MGWADGGTKEFVYCGRYMVADFMIEKLPKDQGSFKVIKFLLTPLAADRAAAVAAVAAVGETRFRGATRSKVRRTLRIGPGSRGDPAPPAFPIVDRFWLAPSHGHAVRLPALFRRPRVRAADGGTVEFTGVLSADVADGTERYKVPLINLVRTNPGPRGPGPLPRAPVD